MFVECDRRWGDRWQGVYCLNCTPKAKSESQDLAVDGETRLATRAVPVRLIMSEFV